MGARGALALTYSGVGHEADAHAILADAALDQFGSVPLDGEWLNTLALFADVSADLEDVETAGMLFDLLEPFGSQAAADGTNVGGTVARLLGRLAAVLGRGDADDWFSQAETLDRRLGAPLFEAITQAQWAGVLARRQTPEEPRPGSHARETGQAHRGRARQPTGRRAGRQDPRRAAADPGCPASGPRRSGGRAWRGTLRRRQVPP